MAYRDDSEPLKERYESLTKALDDVRAQSKALATQEEELGQELEALRPQLEARHFVADCPVEMRERRSRALVATMLGAGACALLSVSAIARVVTSEISPIELGGPEPPVYAAGPEAVTAEPEDEGASRAFSAAEGATEGMGFAWVEAPEGTRMYEGEDFLGTAPLVTPMPAGMHLLRGFHPRNGQTATVLAVVHDGETATFVVDFSDQPAGRGMPRHRMLSRGQ